MKTYKITFWKFIKPSIIILIPLIFFICFMTMLMFGLWCRDGNVPVVLVVVTVLSILFFGVPNLVLHINYYHVDKNKKLHIDFNKDVVTIQSGAKENVFFLKDVVKVQKIGMCPSKSYKYTTTASWRHFYYYKIKLQDSSTLYFTRLIVQNLELLLPALPYEYLQHRYPLIKKISTDQ